MSRLALPLWLRIVLCAMFIALTALGLATRNWILIILPPPLAVAQGVQIAKSFGKNPGL